MARWGEARLTMVTVQVAIKTQLLSLLSSTRKTKNDKLLNTLALLTMHLNYTVCLLSPYAPLNHILVWKKYIMLSLNVFCSFLVALCSPCLYSMECYLITLWFACRQEGLSGWLFDGAEDEERGGPRLARRHGSERSGDAMWPLYCDAQRRRQQLGVLQQLGHVSRGWVTAGESRSFSSSGPLIEPWRQNRLYSLILSILSVGHTVPRGRHDRKGYESQWNIGGQRQGKIQATTGALGKTKYNGGGWGRLKIAIGWPRNSKLL